jgi:hypothetical protein
MKTEIKYVEFVYRCADTNKINWVSSGYRLCLCYKPESLWRRIVEWAKWRKNYLFAMGKVTLKGRFHEIKNLKEFWD